MNRIAKAILHAVVAFFIAGVISCGVLIKAVSNLQDGQAGMGAGFGTFYIACFAAIITLIVSLRKSSPRRNTNI